jgi:hypothetical protein
MILCHIVGINNKLKKSFVDEMLNINNNIVVLDLDEISKTIMFDKEFNIYYNQFISNNITINKDKDNNKIILLSKLSNIWKNKFTDNINNFLNINKNKYIILIGLITFYLDYRIKINLNEDIKYKFFINTNTTEHIKQLIEHNIDFYRNDIINGNFPIKYIDLSFLKNQREYLKDAYLIRDYKLKNYDTIINWIKISINNLQIGGSIDKYVYVASFNRYEDSFSMFESTIGYTDKWLALISLFPRNKFKRGITFKGGAKTPYIKELSPLCLKDLNTCCYIYEMNPSKKIDEHRYLVENDKFIKRYYVSNIKNDLLLDGAIIDKYYLKNNS